MAVQLSCEFESVATHKAPYHYPVDAAVLLPGVGPVVEVDEGSRHMITARVFDRSETPGSSLLLLCCSADEDEQGPFLSSDDPGDIGVTKDE